MKTVFALVLALVLALTAQLEAQTSALPTPITIHGTVVEGGVNSPIANATVILDRPGVTPREQEQTTSAADGSFQFKIQTTGSFTVSASLKGYTGIAGRFGSPSDVQGVLVEPQTKGPLDVRLVLARQAMITGKIVDFEKNTPIPGMNVALRAISYASGRLLQLWTTVAPTDENGQFEIQPPSTGRFVLSIRDAPSSLSEHITTETLNEASVEYRYETPYWPGVDDIESARIFELASGSRTNAGTLALRAVPHYSARVSVRGADCDQDAPIATRLSRIVRDSPRDVLQGKQITCGQDFDLRALLPGRYQLVELRDEMALPRGVTGPLDLAPLAREMSARERAGVSGTGLSDIILSLFPRAEANRGILREGWRRNGKWLKGREMEGGKRRDSKIDVSKFTQGFRGNGCQLVLGWLALNTIDY